MLKHSFPSIEKFAAFLDDNLSQSEMLQFSEMAEHDSVLHRLLDASDVVDNTLAGLTDSDTKLPLEIEGDDFDLPVIPSEGISQLLTLSPEPMGDMHMTAKTANIADNMQGIGDLQENNSEYHDDSLDFDNFNSQILCNDDGIGDLQDTIFSSDNLE